jgi:hypothetical protein
MGTSGDAPAHYPRNKRKVRRDAEADDAPAMRGSINRRGTATSGLSGRRRDGKPARAALGLHGPHTRNIASRNAKGRGRPEASPWRCAEPGRRHGIGRFFLSVGRADAQQGQAPYRRPTDRWWLCLLGAWTIHTARKSCSLTFHWVNTDPQRSLTPAQFCVVTVAGASLAGAIPAAADNSLKMSA